MILVDANTVIHYVKGREPVVRRWQSASPQDLAIPSIVVYEIQYGTLRIGARRRSLVSELLAGIVQVSFDGEAARDAAHIRFDLETRGLIIGPLDLLVAGTALSRNATLVTNNTKEFSRVKGLRLMDWTK
ncbi:MAG TPA: PIN domain-containing protein [Bryobacteraceae bacterium]|jgi:tRNA(fMet)-specific endonuclease VapC